MGPKSTSYDANFSEVAVNKSVFLVLGVRSLCRAAAAIALGLSLAAPALSDTVVLTNGDRITGDVMTLVGGTLTVDTKQLGTVSVGFSGVESMTVESPRGIVVVGGTRLVGTLASEADGVLHIETEAGPWDGKTADLVSIGPVELPTPQEPAWTGSLELGIDGETGNSEKFGLRTAIEARRQSEKLLLTGRFRARYSKEDGQTTDDDQRLSGRVEYSYARRRFWYGAVDFERDDIKSLDLRSEVTGGLGRIWWNSGANFLKTLAGLGFTHESYGNDTEDTQAPICELVMEHGKRIGRGAVIKTNMRYVQQLDDIEGVRGEGETAMFVDLTNGGDLKLKTGVRLEYDNQPARDAERLDTYYDLSIVKTF